MVRRSATALAAAALVLAGCTEGGRDSGRAPGGAVAGSSDNGDDGPAIRLVDAAAEPHVLPAATAEEAALDTSAALFEQAPLAVLAAADDLGAQATAASTAVALGVPLLLTPAAPPAGQAPASEALPRELDRLQTTTVLAVGPGAAEAAGALDVDDIVTAPADPADLADLVGAQWSAPVPTTEPDVTTAAAALDRDEPALLVLDPQPAVSPAPTQPAPTEPEDGGDAVLPELDRPDADTATAVLTTGATADLAAVATAKAAGADVVVVPTGDPRATATTVTALHEVKPQRTLALGPAFGDDARLAQRTAVASTGLQLPAGGQTVFPGRRFVALYGHPGSPALGVLGEQPLDAAIERAKEVAAEYEPYSEVPVVPALEVIATVASGSPGPDGDYSNEADLGLLRPWVEAAGQAGLYVVLDLQPGRTDFLTQVQRYESLLAYPHVGLALDPEWRLGPDERHLEQIGTVGIDEVNAVSAWLADLTRTHDLPQKLLVLHQFTPSMITGRERLDLSHDELAVSIHADGHGSPGAKRASWDRLRAGAPEGIWWAWKNFYDEDVPTFTPEQTYAIEPRPVLVSYQ